MDMRYNLVLGDYRRLRNFTDARDKMGTCPNELRHGRSEKPHNPSKGGRCLINCIGGSKIYIHNAVVATLAKLAQVRAHTNLFAHRVRECMKEVECYLYPYVHR